jgi:hypothetical protein
MTVGNVHTYLFKPGLWRADGEYFDAAGSSYPVEGESCITHAKEMWINESRMRIVGNEKTAFGNDYRITPFCEDRDFTVWHCDSDVLGKLSGRFVHVGDSILSLYRSDDSQYAGTEYWLRISGILYRNRGTLFHGNDKLSSWMIRLNRV